MNILFVTATRIGDAVLSTGLLSHLVERHPGARFTIAAGPLAAPLFAAVPGLERLIAVTKRPGSLHWLPLLARVAGRRWDLVVDLRGSALAWMLRAGERRVMAKGDPREHRVRQLARLFDLDPPPSPRLWTAPEHRARRRGAAAAGPAGAGDRAGRELARQAVARRAIRRTGAAADGERRSVCRRPDRGHGGGARTRAGCPAACVAAAPADDRPCRPHRSVDRRRGAAALHCCSSATTPG